MFRNNEFSEQSIRKMRQEGLVTFVLLRGLARGLVSLFLFIAITAVSLWFEKSLWHNPPLLPTAIAAVFILLIGIAIQWQVWYVASKRDIGMLSPHESTNANPLT